MTHSKTVHTRNRQAPGAYVPPRAPRALTLPSTPPRHQGTCRGSAQLLPACCSPSALLASVPVAQRAARRAAVPSAQSSPACLGQVGPGCTPAQTLPASASRVGPCQARRGSAAQLAHAQTAPCAPPTSLLPPAAPAPVPVLPSAAASAPKAAAAPPLVPPLLPARQALLPLISSTWKQCHRSTGIDQVVHAKITQQSPLPTCLHRPCRLAHPLPAHLLPPLLAAAAHPCRTAHPTVCASVTSEPGTHYKPISAAKWRLARRAGGAPPTVLPSSLPSQRVPRPLPGPPPTQASPSCGCRWAETSGPPRLLQKVVTMPPNGRAPSECEQ